MRGLSRRSRFFSSKRDWSFGYGTEDLELCGVRTVPIYAEDFLSRASRGKIELRMGFSGLSGSRAALAKCAGGYHPQQPRRTRASTTMRRASAHVPFGPGFFDIRNTSIMRWMTRSTSPIMRVS